MQSMNGFDLSRLVIKQVFPHCKRCGHIVKEEIFGFSCANCESLLFGSAVEWKEVSLQVS